MSTEKNRPGTAPEHESGMERPPGTPAEAEVERRTADLEEDRRRQKELDYAELGGEA